MIFKNGAWKGTLLGAIITAAPLLAWNVYITTRTEGVKAREVSVSEARDMAAWRALVTKHVEETEPLKQDYLTTKQQTMLNTQAILVVQTGMASMQEDLRAIRDYIYGRRPGEQRRP